MDTASVRALSTTALTIGAKVWKLFCGELKYLSTKQGFSLGSDKIDEPIMCFRQ